MRRAARILLLVKGPLALERRAPAILDIRYRISDISKANRTIIFIKLHKYTYIKYIYINNKNNKNNKTSNYRMSKSKSMSNIYIYIAIDYRIDAHAILDYGAKGVA